MEATPSFAIRHTQSGTVEVLHLSGVLDESAGPELQRLVAGLSTGGPLGLVCDLSGLRYASSAGIGALVTIHRHLRSDGGILVLAQPSDSLAEMLHTLSLGTIIPVHDTLERAIAAAAGAGARGSSPDRTAGLQPRPG